MTLPTGFKLLLVEDEPTQRMLLERLLEQAGYLVETANDGHEALEKILRDPFHILITDWDMPGMDGRMLCQRVREASLPTYLYILLLTSYSSSGDVVAGLESGADDFLTKPANQPELLARLNAGSRIVRLEQSLREANAKIERMLMTDALVGTFNRRYLDEQLSKDVASARRYGRPLSVVMADLDHFKPVNDEHGHQVGDEVLRHFAELAAGALRASDWIARYGGEEFVIVLPETGISGAAGTAEKIRALCAAGPIETANGAVSVTASFGVATLTHGEDLPNPTAALLREADTALYTSKRDGRNRVSIAEHSGQRQT